MGRGDAALMLEGIATAAAALAGFGAWAARGRSSQVLAPSIWRGPRDRPTIALTFDDGPSESTPLLVDVLAQYGARATFFQCGQNARRLPHIARAISAAGHEIGNHTQTHARLWLRSGSFINDEISRAQDTLASIHGVRPRLFRATYGVRWFGLREVQLRLDLTGVMWTAIGRDWTLPASLIAGRLARWADNGAILCLHDGRELQTNPDIGETIEAVRRLIPALAGRGFRFETVSGMLQRR